MAIDYLREFGPMIERLASESGKIIIPYFNGRNFGLERKSDDSPVTLADRKAEERMRAIIAAEFPEHGMIAEEFGNEKEDAEYVWVFDPIDGTISFVSGCPLFGTLIGLLHRGQPVLGAINQPIVGQLCMGNNMTTTLNERPVRVGSTRRIEKATVLTTDLQNVERYQNYEVFDGLRRRARMFRTWGDCYGYLLVASGGADVMMDPVMNPWDLLPLIPVIRGAGGVITGWDGRDVLKADSCVAANPALHCRVIATLLEE